MNGQIRLLITIFKQESKNEDVDGHIYFDNFRYEIGSPIKPSEANLTLNGQPIIDAAVGAEGSVDIYADPTQKEEAPLINCWNTDQTFQFRSNYANISYNYEYSMHIKNISLGAANSAFTAPANQNPTWIVDYFVPSGRPPSGYSDYAFGVHLASYWAPFAVNDSIGQPIVYTFNATTLFIKTQENEAVVGETYSIYSSSINWVENIQLQKRSTPTGP